MGEVVLDANENLLKKKKLFYYQSFISMGMINKILLYKSFLLPPFSTTNQTNR